MKTKKQVAKIQNFSKALKKYRDENPQSKKDDFGVFASSTSNGKLYFSEYYDQSVGYYDEVCLMQDGSYSVTRNTIHTLI